MNDLLIKEYEEFFFTYKLYLSNMNLTRRECEISYLITKGLSNRKIGELLFISEVTVKKHIYNIFNKCGVGRRFEFYCNLRESQINLIEKAC